MVFCFNSNMTCIAPNLDGKTDSKVQQPRSKLGVILTYTYMSIVFVYILQVSTAS